MIIKSIKDYTLFHCGARQGAEDSCERCDGPGGHHHQKGANRKIPGTEGTTGADVEHKAFYNQHVVYYYDYT